MPTSTLPLLPMSEVCSSTSPLSTSSSSLSSSTPIGQWLLEHDVDILMYGMIAFCGLFYGLNQMIQFYTSIQPSLAKLKSRVLHLIGLTIVCIFICIGLWMFMKVGSLVSILHHLSASTQSFMSTPLHNHFTQYSSPASSTSTSTWSYESLFSYLPAMFGSSSTREL